MADRSSIEWTEATWNPVTGCDKVSEGCDHCYIERTMPFRLEGRRFDQQGRMGIRVHPERLDVPVRWRKPRLVFVNSLSDLFHPDVDADTIAAIFATMRETPQHQFQVLTKRPQRMARHLKACDWWTDPAPNVWLGTSVELDKYSYRADHLRDTPAAVRWLSLEPLLGPLPSLDLTGIDWVVIGGESGPGARPMDVAWAEEIVDGCQDADIPVFVKQLGSIVGGRHHHDIDRFPESLRVRRFPVGVTNG